MAAAVQGRLQISYAERGPGGAAATSPRRIVVAGDSHGEQDRALHVIGHVPGLCGGENTRLILQLGDFGIWPDTAGELWRAASQRQVPSGSSTAMP